MRNDYKYALCKGKNKGDLHVYEVAPINFVLFENDNSFIAYYSTKSEANKAARNILNK